MALTIGTQLGSYEITALLGKGGMGEVYRARDTKLKRDVAIKVLPDEFSRDADRVSRFQREAEVLASLNHSNVAAIYDLQEANGSRYLVLELVEGETLGDRIARGPIPVEEALDIAKNICEALEAAHEKGIIHRDLKPANVKITPDGKVKVLDFGLAKAMSGTTTATTLSNSPTLVSGSMGGMIVGTAAYMSPEQARGREADQRSDVFAFGCVLYEMLTGRQAFQGEDVSDVLASVMKIEPDMNLLPANLSPRLRELLGRCLAKNRKDRWYAVGDLRVELETIIADPLGVKFQVVRKIPPRPLWKRAIPAAAWLLVGAVIAGTAAWTLKPSRPLAITRFPILLGEGQQFTNTGRNVLAISPDGTQIIYVANRTLYHRPMYELEARLIPGTGTQTAVLSPVFSPDGQSVVFWTELDRTLKKISVNGGTPITLCPVDIPLGMSWTTDGILVAQSGKEILRVSPNAGKPEVLVSTKSETATLPYMLPGGKAVLFTLHSGTDPDKWDKAQIVVQTLASGERKTLIEGGSDGRYVPSGHIVYAFSGTLRAVAFDLQKLQVTSGAVPVLEGVRRGNTDGVAQYVFSDNGSLIYVPGPATNAFTQRDLALIDRKGSVELLKLPPGPKEAARFSPDGKRVAFGSDDGKEAIVSIYDLAGTSAPRRLTFGGRNRFPLWSSDGQRIAFQSNREGDLGIFWQRADGTGTAERLTKPNKDTAHVPESWSPNGEGFLFNVVEGSTHSLWMFSFKDKKAAPFGSVQSSIPPNAVFSPDGKWVAYASDETGRREVYVQPFPSTGAKYQVLSPGAINPHHPLWSPDGRELFYIPTGGQAVVVSFTAQPSVSFGKPEPVTGMLDQGGPGTKRNTDIGPNGRFIGVVAADEAQPAGSPAIQVVLNWFTEVQRRVPVK
jgi:serine/threonine protein kinase/Tol biopolymer transport system component